MAATLRFLLLRRRADTPSAPSLALLQPLFPRSHSKLIAPPVPSPTLLRRTSGEGCSALLPPVPRKPSDRGREATQRPIQPSSPLLVISTTSNILGMQRMPIHPSPPHVPSLIRHYSSKGCVPPLPQQPIDPQTCQCKQAQSLLQAVNSLAEQPALVLKGIETCEKACELLGAGVYDDKVFAVFEKGLDDALIALAVYEKALDVLAEALGSAKEMQLDIDLEPYQMMCKSGKSSLESMRQELKEIQRAHETQRMLEKICKRLQFANVILGSALVLLMLQLITIYLA